MKTTLSMHVLLALGIIVTQNVSAGPLGEKYRAEQASAVAGALTAQRLIHSFNTASPFIDHYQHQYANAGFVRTPVSPSGMFFLKARLLWEYGPLSAKALAHVENLNDAIFSIARENPSLLNNPAELKDEITRKIDNLASREKTFQGLQAEASEARHRGWWLTKRNDSQTFDIYDPKTGSSYQMKVFKTASGSLRGLKEDYAGFATKHPEKAKYFKGMMPEDQIQEMVAAGKLKKYSSAVEVGTRNGITKQTAYLDAESGFKVIAAQSEPTAAQFRANVRKGYAIQKQLSHRPAGLGRASVSGLIVVSGISIIAQIYQGEGVNWTSVAESGGVGLASSAATVVLAQNIEQRFGTQMAQSFMARNIARGTLSRAAAPAVVGAVVVLGFVANDYLTDQITAKDALFQSIIGLGAVGVSVGASVIVTSATVGTIAGSELPIVGNVAGFVAGLVVGTVVYVGGNWYYENFKLEGLRAEMLEFKKTASKWNAEKKEKELAKLREQASILRAEAARTLH